MTKPVGYTACKRQVMTWCLAVQVADIEKAEKEKMRAKVENIISQGLNCFVNRQLIYNFPEEIFADAGVMAIEHADFDGIERLALVTGQHCCELIPCCSSASSPMSLACIAESTHPCMHQPATACRACYQKTCGVTSCLQTFTCGTLSEH